MIVRLSVPGNTATGAASPDPIYGEQLQTQGVLGEVAAEGTVDIRWRTHSITLTDGERVSLRKPQLLIRSLAFGPLAKNVRTSLRIAPPLRGLGLLEAAQFSPNKSGVINRAWDISQRQFAPGRFGWKAEHPDLRQQIAHAYHQDMGVTSRLFAVDNCGPTQIACLRYPSPGHPELSDEKLDDLTFMLRTLAQPEAAMHMRDRKVVIERGKKLFASIGCASCHTPELHTAVSAALSSLAQRTLRPYTDLRLHDMGEGLADHRPEFAASGSAWRTAPLWGLGSDHSSLLHDGRARTIVESILWHGGEAAKARNAFRRMSQAKRASLTTFLESL
jgi:CxxC motif-containing protein (DUF1111 family)